MNPGFGRHILELPRRIWYDKFELDLTPTGSYVCARDDITFWRSL